MERRAEGRDVVMEGLAWMSSFWRDSGWRARWQGRGNPAAFQRQPPPTCDQPVREVFRSIGGRSAPASVSFIAADVAHARGSAKPTAWQARSSRWPGQARHLPPPAESDARGQPVQMQALHASTTRALFHRVRHSLPQPAAAAAGGDQIEKARSSASLMSLATAVMRARSGAAWRNRNSCVIA